MAAIRLEHFSTPPLFRSAPQRVYVNIHKVNALKICFPRICQCLCCTVPLYYSSLFYGNTWAACQSSWTRMRPKVSAVLVGHWYTLHIYVHSLPFCLSVCIIDIRYSFVNFNFICYWWSIIEVAGPILFYFLSFRHNS